MGARRVFPAVLRWLVWLAAWGLLAGRGEPVRAFGLWTLPPESPPAPAATGQEGYPDTAAGRLQRLQDEIVRGTGYDVRDPAEVWEKMKQAARMPPVPPGTRSGPERSGLSVPFPRYVEALFPFFMWRAFPVTPDWIRLRAELAAETARKNGEITEDGVARYVEEWTGKFIKEHELDKYLAFGVQLRCSFLPPQSLYLVDDAGIYHPAHHVKLVENDLINWNWTGGPSPTDRVFDLPITTERFDRLPTFRHIGYEGGTWLVFFSPEDELPVLVPGSFRAWAPDGTRIDGAVSPTQPNWVCAAADLTTAVGPQWDIERLSWLFSSASLSLPPGLVPTPFARYDRIEVEYVYRFQTTGEEKREKTTVEVKHRALVPIELPYSPARTGGAGAGRPRGEEGDAGNMLAWASGKMMLRLRGVSNSLFAVLMPGEPLDRLEEGLVWLPAGGG
ncbi:MAG TPA: hypothetical protein GXX55_00900 [Firmicutes bacterium]|nr:hypothetical protein [Bacillota bacterium]